MHLVNDCIHPYKSAGGRRAQCRVRIYLCSELPTNPGGSVTNSVEVIATGVIRANSLPTERPQTRS